MYPKLSNCPFKLQLLPKPSASCPSSLFSHLSLFGLSANKSNKMFFGKTTHLLYHSWWEEPPTAHRITGKTSRRGRQTALHFSVNSHGMCSYITPTLVRLCFLRRYITISPHWAPRVPDCPPLPAAWCPPRAQTVTGGRQGDKSDLPRRCLSALIL